MAKASFVGAGDLLIVRDDPASLLGNVEAMMQEADIAYLNLEGPMCDVGAKNPALTGIANAIRSTPKLAPALKEAGVDVVSLANNHTMDYGAEGLTQTLDLLRRHGIAQCGGGRDLAEARAPLALTANGIRVAFLAYTSVCPPSYAATPDGPGAAVVRVATSYDANLRIMLQPGSPLTIRTAAHPDDLALVREEVRAAKAQADIVIVAWHWGVSERWGKLCDYQRECGRAVIEAGADLVLGNHAHMLLGIEFHQGKPIFYSLGNFAFDMRHRFFLPENLIVRCDFTQGGVENLRIVPILNNADLVPEIATGETARKFVWKLEELSEGLNCGLVLRDGEIHAAPLR